ncbi:hypothetical protein O0L34_g1954 [Tuta absoluta]|nr:hypothetical protein O0L34_g1954 [Tuta absoluta]
MKLLWTFVVTILIVMISTTEAGTKDGSRIVFVDNDQPTRRTNKPTKNNDKDGTVQRSNTSTKFKTTKVPDTVSLDNRNIFTSSNCPRNTMRVGGWCVEQAPELNPEDYAELYAESE